MTQALPEHTTETIRATAEDAADWTRQTLAQAEKEAAALAEQAQEEIRGHRRTVVVVGVLAVVATALAVGVILQRRRSAHDDEA